MLSRIPWVLLGVAIIACGGKAATEGSAGSGAATGSTNAATTSASGGSGGGVSTASGGSSGVACNPSTVLCDLPPPDCMPGEVPSVRGSCWGPCVPILDCATEPSCDNCSTGFCAEYVAQTVEYRCVAPTLLCSALVCSCVAPYFCAAPFDACVATMGPADVRCECSTC